MTSMEVERIARFEKQLGHRHVQILTVAADYPSYAVIGDILKIRPGTVKSRLHRARKALADLEAKEATERP